MVSIRHYKAEDEDVKRQLLTTTKDSIMRATTDCPLSIASPQFHSPVEEMNYFSQFTWVE